MNQFTAMMRAYRATVAGGIHASSITPQAAYDLLEANKAVQRATGKPLGAWCHQGEYVPVWTGVLRLASDRERFEVWCKGHRAHGAKQVRVEPVNGFSFNDIPDGLFIGVRWLTMHGKRCASGVLRLA